MLKLRNLNHAFGAVNLKYPDWEVSSGDHALILGDSGSGKTTLLHLIGGLMRPENGEVIVCDQPISQLKGGKLDQFRGKNIGIIFQRPHLVKSLTVMENLILTQKLGGKTKDLAKIDQLLNDLAIESLGKRKVHQISQGQAQRVSIARALVNAPRLLLADEPTASLDDENCKRVIQLLKNQAKIHSSTLVVATHDQRVKQEFKNHLTL